MTKFGDWARGPTLASVYSSSQAQQRIRDLANLAAQMHEQLECSILARTPTSRACKDTAAPVRVWCGACRAVRAAEEFMEKYA